MLPNHLLFEEWLLTDEPLSTEQTAALQLHLQECASCQRLATAWKEVERTLHHAPMAAPSENFMQCWETRLGFEQVIRMRRQNLAILLFCVGGAAALFVTLGVLLFPALRSPLLVFLGGLYALAENLFQISEVLRDGADIIKTIFVLVPTSLWVGLGAALAGLSVIWMATLRRLGVVRRMV